MVVARRFRGDTAVITRTAACPPLWKLSLSTVLHLVLTPKCRNCPRPGQSVGEQHDPCYHLACDTFDNISLEVLDSNADAVATSGVQSAMNTESVNGNRGKGNFKDKPSQNSGSMNALLIYMQEALNRLSYKVMLT